MSVNVAGPTMLWNMLAAVTPRASTALSSPLDGKRKRSMEMIDLSNKQRITVSTNGDVGHYILVSVDQLSDIRKLLDDSDIRYSVDGPIRHDREDATAVVNLESEGSQAVQEILDNAAVMISISFVDGSLQEYFKPESLVSQLASLIEAGYKGKSLVDELLTDDWGAPPMSVTIEGMLEGGRRVHEHIPYR